MTQPTDNGNEISHVNTDGGTYIEGNVEAQEFVGRDKHVHGDEVHGNKVIIQRLDPADARNQRNHKAMRQRVRQFWIDGVLKHSLYKEVLIRLNLEKRPNAVDNQPWNLALYQYGQPDTTLPGGTPIIDVFDQMNQLLLILGEPGSGKTTMLLELADALIKRAEADPTHPTPIVLTLSSWAEKKEMLAKWLIDELHSKYSISRKIAQNWVDNDELLLLLDGLDEVGLEHRDSCVNAINQFRQEHLVPMAVCSRVAEYADLTTKLRLQGAVLVQPLTLGQIDDYLNIFGSELPSIRLVLKTEKELQDLATSPLMLSIMILSYNKELINDLSLSDVTTRKHHLFNTYIYRLFAHRGTPPIYPVSRTIYWLSWLADNMNKRQQSVFLIERLQPNWLQIHSFTWIPRLIFGLVGCLLGGLLGGLFVGLLSGLIWGLIFGLALGLMFGLVFGLLDIELAEQLEFNRKGSIKGLIVGMSGGLMYAIFLALNDDMKVSFVVKLLVIIIAGSIIALVSGLLGALINGINSRSLAETTYPNQGVWYTVRNMVIGGLISMIIVGLVIGIMGKLISGLSFGLIVGLFIALIQFGGIGCTQHLILRALLWIYNYAPFNYARFLNYCHDRLFLRKVGGGYIFIHRMLMEHFASLTDEDIQRIARDVETVRRG